MAERPDGDEATQTTPKGYEIAPAPAELQALQAELGDGQTRSTPSAGSRARQASLATSTPRSTLPCGASSGTVAIKGSYASVAALRARSCPQVTRTIPRFDVGRWRCCGLRSECSQEEL